MVSFRAQWRIVRPEVMASTISEDLAGSLELEPSRLQVGGC